MELKVNFYKSLGGLKLNVQLEAGAANLALIGESGSGKTAALQCIAGLLKPDTGSILLDDEVFFDSERHIHLPPQSRRIGYLSSGGALFPHMTVRQNIAAGVRSRSEVRALTEEQLIRFGLEDVAELRPGRLPPILRLRTALARISASRPAVMLLDNPFSGVDTALRSPLELELADCLSGFDGPVIWASRDRGEIFRNCRYVCVMESGTSQEIVTVGGLFSQPRTESAARLTGVANFADAIPRENAVFLPQWGVTLRCAYPLPPFLWRVGIRARHVRISDAGDINAFTADVVRVFEDLTATVILLRPVGAAETAPLLRMEVDRGVWQGSQNRSRLTVSVGPSNILLLRQSVT